MNKLNFNQEFTNAVLTITKLTSKSSQIIFCAESGLLTVVTYGGEVCVRRCFQIDSKVKLKFAMKANELEALLTSFTHGTLKAEEGRLTLTSGKTHLVRTIIPSHEIYDPIFPTETENETEITSDVFEMASYVAYAASKADTRPTAERIAFSVKNNCLRAYAMDGYRFATVEASCDTVGDGQEYMLRPSLIAALNTLIKKEKIATISIGSTTTKYLIRLGELEICVSRLTESGQHSIIEAVLKKSDENKFTRVTFSRSEMLVYLQRINLIEDKNESHAVVLTLNPENKAVNISFKCTTGRVDDMFDASYTNDSVAHIFAVKPEYLFDICQKTQNSEISMQLVSPTVPILLRESYNCMEFVHCVLPVRINSEIGIAATKQSAVDSKLAVSVPDHTTNPVSAAEDLDVDDTDLAS